MNTSKQITQIRKDHHLSQEELAERLHVTRQAVSRWETGETTPNIDTLKQLSNLFHISIDELLDHSSPICQSCGMTLSDDDKGSEADGSISNEYCVHCYQHGAFTKDLTMEEMINENLQDLNEWNQEQGLQLNEEQARNELREFLPSLKRWHK